MKMISKKDLKQAEVELTELIEKWMMDQNWYSGGDGPLLSNDIESYMARAAVTVLEATAESQADAVQRGSLVQVDDEDA